MSLALLLKYWKAGLIVVLAVACLAFVSAWRSSLIAEGRAKERLHVQDSTLAVLSKQAAKIDTVYQRDTIRLTRSIARTDTLRDTLMAHLTDTVLVKQFVASTDSTIHACTEVANTCAAKLANADARIATLTAMKFPPPVYINVPSVGQKAEYTGGGAVLGALLSHFLWKSP